MVISTFEIIRAVIAGVVSIGIGFCLLNFALKFVNKNNTEETEEEADD